MESRGKPYFGIDIENYDVKPFLLRPTDPDFRVLVKELVLAAPNFLVPPPAAPQI